jgi:hypothetical protein
MASLIRFLEAARTVWRTIVLVVGVIAIYSAYQYQNHQPNLFSGDEFGAIYSATKENSGRFFDATINRVLGRPKGGMAVPAPTVADGAGAETPIVDHGAGGSHPRGQSERSANISASESSSRSPGNGGVVSAGPVAEHSSVALVSPDSRAPLDADNPRARLAFRRLASQFCRATRSLALYYSDRVNGPNGDAATRVGSGVRFPSIDRLTGGRDRSLAEKELEVRLRCDYELAYGTGDGADPNRPEFEQWRQATLERQYGGMWTRIDLTHIPTPDDPMSRGDWYLYTPPSQE